uniref:RNA helicase n=1 Tax=Thermosporothrix sp. COM3 TaxID=2490863 RepID=A0A455SS18_9CHLR|nr:RNA helicase [Thermosporothrix sp. COM3]
MALLEELRPGMQIKGLLPQKTVTLIDVKSYGSAVEITFKDANGQPGSQLLYTREAAALEIISTDTLWKFDADGAHFRLISEAYRIHLAHLFDPLVAVHSSLIDPLPHQITAVYSTMLSRHPLRYLLADDPGAGKTVMTGLLLKELLIRGDLHRCLIVAPGSLVEQWQDELKQKFDLRFEILTRDRLENSFSGNIFQDLPLCIARLDMLARNEETQELLKQCEWDLVVVDEAHKLSATVFSGEVKYTRRYQLGDMLGQRTRHFLLLTATPHNGKAEDFSLFMRLLDHDRFEGTHRESHETPDVSDLMRHMLKEELFTFEGTRLFPERKAYVVNYTLSGPEKQLYEEVTDYVKNEFDRADSLEQKSRRGTIGFALTILQRRLASSPEAIYQSLRRRKERLQKRLDDALQMHADETAPLALSRDLPLFESDELEELEELPDAELEKTEDLVVDQASAARTIAELKAEILRLARLEELALRVRRSGTDRKWEELANLLQSDAMFDNEHHRHKLVLFTEHKDTLNYLADRIQILLGWPEAVVTIHGGMRREERLAAQHAFTQNKDILILIATDAAGEGINLQRAHLMVNYDLPWNPNRLEQRFGRIHRIGQTEVCHLWNLVAHETREGEVFHTLLKKLERENEALGGKVFDVLGKLHFADRSLKDLIVEAIRYGNDPAVRARTFQKVESALDHRHVLELLEQRALVHEVMDVARVRQVREEMERAAARRLQPHFIEAFFLAACEHFGVRCSQYEPHRYQIRHVPLALRKWGQATRNMILESYERIAFEKKLLTLPGKPPAELIYPGHPLLDATLHLLLERYQGLLKQGAVLVDPLDQSEEPRVLFYLEHTIQEAASNASGRHHVVSRQLHFLEINRAGEIRTAGYAPFLDYRALEDEELSVAEELKAQPWLRADLEERVRAYAIEHLVPHHFREVEQRRKEHIRKTRQAVHERLTREAMYWDARSVDLLEKEEQGKPNARQNSQQARQRAEELRLRRDQRLAELEHAEHLSVLPPVVVGCALILPVGLLRKHFEAQPSPNISHDTAIVEHIAMQTVMAIEQENGYIPRDVSSDKCGYDIESRIPGSGKLRFIEVKGRQKGAETITVTKNEILTALNKPEDFFLAIVEVDGERTTTWYVQRPFERKPDFKATSVNYNLKAMIRGVPPVCRIKGS